MIEYRVCWNASSNITFSGSSDWAEWDDSDTTHELVADELSEPEGGRQKALPIGLEEALQASGFDWWIETREASS